MTNHRKSENKLMKAVVFTEYGTPDVLKIKEVEKPVPKDKEVLIKILATTVNSGDRRIRSMDLPPGFRILGRLMFGITGPRQPILGVTLAGTIESVGKEVTKFKAGDHILAMDGFGMKAYAEYKTMPEDGGIILKPEGLTFEEAAAIPFGGTTALDYLRNKGHIKPGEKVLINGASGAVGVAAVQLAKHFGAEVTGVCSARNMELVKSVGADKVIDYTREDFTKNGETYDIIMDTVGNVPFSRARNSLKEKGRLLAVVSGMAEMFMSPWINLTGSKKVMVGTARERAEDLQLLATLAETGQFKVVIDRRYPFEQMAEAHRYVDQGHKTGNVVVTIGAQQP